MGKAQQKQRVPAADDGKGSAQQQSPRKVRPPVTHGDLYQRANFTFQASAFLQQLQSQPTLKTEHLPISEGVEDGDTLTKQDNPDLSRLSRNIMAANGKMVIHNQMKLDPSMKRNICKTCSTVLISGLTSRIRNRPSRTHFNVTHTSCLSCDTTRTVPSPPTSIGEESLDGKKRAARRKKQAKRAKVPFHNRESTATTSTTVKAGSQPAQKGHDLWRCDKTVENWGERPTAADVPGSTTEK